MSHSQGLKVIALVSGGKDSLYSILHCLRNGHKVVALGNLHPPSVKRQPEEGPGPEGMETDEDEEGDDMDSFMYQTIGHSVVPLYEEALGIPLYRQEIKGRAVNEEREYSNATSNNTDIRTESVQDETESIFHLLRRIMKEHPTANAVSAGAILSTYQRTRIENVAGRLGLVSLAWLWMYPYLPPPMERALDPSSAVTGLLDDMAAAGCEARIIKVASAGLDSADVLWGDLAGRDGRVRAKLIRIMGRFLTEGVEAAVIGEGGEYESLALDGPGFLWKKRIVVEETRTVTGEGGVMSLKFKGVRCAEKDKKDEVKLSDIRRPGKFDPEFYMLLNKATQRWKEMGDQSFKEEEFMIPNVADIEEGTWSLCMSQSRGDNAWYISNCSSPEHGPDAAAQMEGIARKLNNAFKSDDVDADDIVFSTILLRSMADFAAINAVYASLFSKPNPPARVTVACGSTLPPDVQVMVSVVVDEGPRRRRNGLHVQSLSYWAPANIGPYSQAVSVPLRKETSLEADGGLVHIAGQIPLYPSTMNLFTSEEGGINLLISQTALSLQHLWRIGRVVEVDWWLGGIAYLSGKERISVKARMAAEIWKAANTNTETRMDDDDEDGCTLDVWDLKYGRQYDQGRNTKIQQRPLPKFDILDTDDTLPTSTPPFFAVQVDELPREAAIEWQGLGTRSADVNITHEDTEDTWTTHTQGSGFGSYMYIGIRNARDSDVQGALRNALKHVQKKQTSDCKQMMTTIYTPYCILDATGLGQIVPCRSVREADGKALVAGIVVHMRP